MNEVGKEIAILSLGAILAVADESIEDSKAREQIERHVKQVAAIIQGKPHNKPDAETAVLIEKLRAILGSSTPVPAAA